MRTLLSYFLACLIPAGALHAATVEEIYQQALMAEKGRGDLEKAIDLYGQVIKKRGDDDWQQALAARAQIRIGICHEKMGLKKAGEAYARIPEQFPENPQTVLDAAARMRATKERSRQLDQSSGVRGFALLPELGVELQALSHQLDAQQYLLERQLDGSILKSALSPEQAKDLWETATREHGGYSNWAYTQPTIPYAHRAVADLTQRQWKFKLDFSGKSPGTKSQYAQKGYDDGDWAEIGVGQAWEDQGYDGYDGGAWYRTEFALRDADGDKPVYLAFGGADENAWVYVNGQFVGKHHVWDKPFALDISEAVKYKGANALAVYVYDRMNMGGLYGTVGVHQPLGDDEVDRYIANKGGSLQHGKSRFGFRGLSRSGSQPRKRYERYANRSPAIPYPHESVAEVPRQWKFRLDFRSGAHPYDSADPLAAKDYDDSDWAEIAIGEAWEDQGYPDHDAGAWYRAEIEVDADRELPVFMGFGGVDKDAWVYVNGQYVGQHHVWDKPFALDISKAVEHKGKNTVALRVYDGTGMGGVYGLIDIYQPKR